MTYRDMIAVGVDGSAGSKAATTWAAEEAARLGAGVLLVHAYTPYQVVGGFYAAAYPPAPVEDDTSAERVLEEAAREAEQLVPGERIAMSVVRADPRTALLQAAARSRMLVVGDEAHPALSRLVTGSVVAPVAAHSPVPVVAVPANWQEASPQGAVVVAVKNIEAASLLVRQAFELAAVHKAGLTVLHAWELLTRYDDAIAEHAPLPEWERRAQADLASIIDPIASQFPEVEVRVTLVHGQAARTLVDASEHADLLVIARRPHAFPFGHLGGTGRAVLRATRCPTIVLPPSVESLDSTVSGERMQPAAPDRVSSLRG